MDYSRKFGFQILARMRAPPGRARGQVGRKTSESSSVVVCDIFIRKWNMNITSLKILQDFTLFLYFKHIFTVQTLYYIVSLFYNIITCVVM